MKLTALFVYSATDFELSRAIEHLMVDRDGTTTAATPAGKQVTLAPGIYRFPATLTVTPRSGAVEGKHFARELIADEKHKWPDPPLEAVMDQLQLTREQVTGFLNGTGSVTHL